MRSRANSGSSAVSVLQQRMDAFGTEDTCADLLLPPLDRINRVDELSLLAALQRDPLLSSDTVKWRAETASEFINEKFVTEGLPCGLTKDEACSLALYTSCNDTFNRVGQCLRNPDREKLSSLLPLLRLLLRGLAKLPRPEVPRMVYRAINTRSGARAVSLSEGDSLAWWGIGPASFQAMATKESCASRAFLVTQPTTTLFAIDALDVVDLSQFTVDGRSEVAVYPGSEFRVVSCRDAGLHWVVHLRQTSAPDNVDCFTQHPNFCLQDAADWMDRYREAATEATGSVKVNGRVVSAAECLVECVSRNPLAAEAWGSLGVLAAAQKHKTITVQGGTFTAKRCFVEAVTNNPLDPLAWRRLAQCADTEFEIDHSWYDRAGCLAKSLQLNRQDAAVWNELAEALSAKSPTATATVGDRKVSCRECLAECVALNPTDKSIWLKLARLLEGTADTLRIADQVYSAIDCFARLAALDPKSAVAWVGLAKLLSEGSTTAIKVNDNVVDKRDCLVAALEANPNDGVVWDMLAKDLAQNPATGGQVTVGGKAFTHSQCVAEAAAKGSSSAEDWYKLGLGLQPGEHISIGGEDHDSVDCFTKAVGIRDKYPDAWEAIATRLLVPRRVWVSGVEHDKAQCFAKTLMHDPKRPHAWCGLGDLLPNTGKGVAVGKKQVTRQNCFAEALALDPSITTAWCKLGKVTSGTVSVGRRTVSGLDCFVEALKQDAVFTEAWLCLGVRLDPGQTALVSGTARDDVACFSEAVATPPPSEFHVNAWFALGKALMRQSRSATASIRVAGGEFKRYGAFDCFGETIVRQPTRGGAWYLAGKLLDPASPPRSLGNFSATALLCFIEAATHDAENGDAWLELGLAIPDKKDKEEIADDVDDDGDILGTSAATVVVNKAHVTKSQCFIQAIALGPDVARAWHCLGDSLGDKEKIVPVKGSTDKVGPIECYVKSIVLDDKRAPVWVSLGLRIPATDSVTIHKKPYTCRGCLTMALSLDPSYGMAWYRLAMDLKTPDESAEINGIARSKQECLRQAVMHEPELSLAWSALGVTIPASGPPVEILEDMYSRKNCFEAALKTSKDPTGTAAAADWGHLGRCLQDDENAEPFGEPMNKVDCFVQSVTFDKTRWTMWTYLGFALAEYQEVTVSDQSYDSVRCYEAALELDPRRSDPWANLGWVLKPGKMAVIKLQPYSKLECYVKALEIKHKDAVTWNNLGGQVSKTGSVKVAGKSFSRLGCYQEALVADPQCSDAWNNIGGLVPAGEKTVEVFGAEKTAIECFKESLKFKLTNSASWYNLSKTLQDKTTVNVQGKEYSPLACCLYALKYNPLHSDSWNQLGIVLSKEKAGEGFARVGDRSYSTLDSYVQALTISRENGAAWTNLGNTLSKGENVVVGDTLFSKAECQAIGKQREEEAENENAE